MACRPLALTTVKNSPVFPQIAGTCTGTGDPNAEEVVLWYFFVLFAILKST